MTEVTPDVQKGRRMPIRQGDHRRLYEVGDGSSPSFGGDEEDVRLLGKGRYTKAKESVDAWRRMAEPIPLDLDISLEEEQDGAGEGEDGMEDVGIHFMLREEPNIVQEEVVIDINPGRFLCMVPGCGSALSRMDVLQKHMRKVHKMSKKDPNWPTNKRWKDKTVDPVSMVEVVMDDEYLRELYNHRDRTEYLLKFSCNLPDNGLKLRKLLDDVEGKIKRYEEDGVQEHDIENMLSQFEMEVGIFQGSSSNENYKEYLPNTIFGDCVEEEVAEADNCSLMDGDKDKESNGYSQKDGINTPQSHIEALTEEVVDQTEGKEALETIDNEENEEEVDDVGEAKDKEESEEEKARKFMKDWFITEDGMVSKIGNIIIKNSRNNPEFNKHYLALKTSYGKEKSDENVIALIKMMVRRTQNYVGKAKTVYETVEMDIPERGLPDEMKDVVRVLFSGQTKTTVREVLNVADKHELFSKMFNTLVKEKKQSRSKAVKTISMFLQTEQDGKRREMIPIDIKKILAEKLKGKTVDLKMLKELKETDEGFSKAWQYFLLTTTITLT